MYIKVGCLDMIEYIETSCIEYSDDYDPPSLDSIEVPELEFQYNNSESDYDSSNESPEFDLDLEEDDDDEKNYYKVEKNNEIKYVQCKYWRDVRFVYYKFKCCDS